MTQKRQPKGIETGGQFAASVNPESTLVLDDGDDLSMSYHVAGNVSNVQVGSRTPWGTADSAHHIAPGIVVVGTPGHGGVKLSPERNRKVPTALRNASGWYEEDCDAYIPMMVHAGDMKRPSESADEAYRRAELGVINWFPDQYERAFNAVLPVGASSQKDQKTWNELHASDEIAVSAISSEGGMVKVDVCRGGRGDRGKNLDSSRTILVPKSDYDNLDLRQPLGKHNGSFIVDQTKHYVDVTPPAPPSKAPLPRFRGIDTSRLGVDARFRAERDLKRVFNFQNAPSRTLREIVESGGVTSKSSMIVSAGRRMYYLRHAVEAEGQSPTESPYALEVSKATWDAVDAPAS
jgi:hypothetical protein